MSNTGAKNELGPSARGSNSTTERNEAGLYPNESLATQNIDSATIHEKAKSEDLSAVELADQSALLTKSLSQSGIDVKAAIARAQLDGCLTTDNLMLWSLINIHFASGAGSVDLQPREVVPLVIPGTFSVKSVWNALAARFGADHDSDISTRDFVLEKLASLHDESAAKVRGNEAIHLAIQIDIKDPLIALSFAMPDGLRTNSAAVWEPIRVAREQFEHSISELSSVLDSLNERYLATFTLFLPEAKTLIGESLADTLWL